LTDKEEEDNHMNDILTGEKIIGKKKILIADDEEHIRNIIRFSLESDGYEVVMAADGEEAIEIAKGEKPDLIVLDIMMPKKDGYEVFHELKAREDTKEIPVIILTVKSEYVYKKISFSVGAEEHIVKPFSLQDLKERIDEILRGEEGKEREDGE